MTFTHALSTNNYGTAKFIVDANAANGTHTTIAAAITSASSGDTIFIRPGTYSENLTITKSINLCGYGFDASYTANNPVISGLLTVSGASVSVSINGLTLASTGAAGFLSLTGNSSIVTLQNCQLNYSFSPAISCTGNAATTLYINNCSANSGTSTLQFFTTTNASIFFRNFYLITGGTGTTPSTTSAGVITVRNSQFNIPITTSSSGSIIAYASSFGVPTSTSNITWLTTAGTGTNYLYNCDIYSGTSSAISIGTGTTVQAVNVTATSSNTNVLTGAGTLNYSFITFPGSSSGHNVTTENAMATLI